MGFWGSVLGGLADVMSPRAQGPPAHHDFWYRPVGTVTPHGMYMAPDTALRNAAVWACINILSKTLAQLPAFVYKRRADGGKDEAPEHPVWGLFRRQPNVWQSAYEFKQYGMTCLLTRGNFYCQKVWGRRGQLSQLVPIHPDRVKVQQLASGRMGYLVRMSDGQSEPLTQDDVFHVRGITLDGVTGLSPLSYASETVGKAMAQEGFAANFYKNSMEASHVITGPKLLSTAAREALKADLAERSGWQNAGKTLVLEEGFTLEQLSLSARDSQFVETSYATIEDICRWFDCPPNIIHHLLRSTFSNVEQESLNYVTLHFLPWCSAWESAAQRDLFDTEEEQEYVLTFNVDALLRGAARDRADAEAIWVQNGIMSENEIRLKENLNPVPGLWEPRRSANQDRGADPRQESGGQAPPPDDEEEEEEEAARSIVGKAAARLVRREVLAIRRQDARGKLDAGWVTDFYARHVEVLTDALCLPQPLARQYGAHHSAELLAQGMEVLDTWEKREPARLVKLALGSQT